MASYNQSDVLAEIVTRSGGFDIFYRVVRREPKAFTVVIKLCILKVENNLVADYLLAFWYIEGN